MGRLFSVATRIIGLAQGKGYGSRTVRREVRAAAALTTSPLSLVIDIGGNKGFYAAAVRSAFPRAEIHVFEPAASNVEILRRRFIDDKLVIVQPYALGESPGQAVLHADASGSGLASLTKRRVEHFGLTFEHHEPVNVARFDDYWTGELKQRPIDLAKLDVEGHELDVLKGFGEALAHTQIVQFEFGGCNIDTRTYFQDFWYFFRTRGFDLYRIAPLGLQRVREYSELDEFFLTTNFLARAARH